MMRGASSGGLPLSVSSSATTSPRPGDRGFESRPSSGESTANPVGLVQVEWPVRLVYAGRAGTGINTAELERLWPSEFFYSIKKEGTRSRRDPPAYARSAS